MKKLKMKKHKTKGLLFTFCGLDGSGKTTMMNRLIDDLNNEYAVVATKQPTDVVRNSEIFRTYMDSSEHDRFDYRSLSLLAASDRVQHCNKVILPELESGKIVISDRYFYSCLANLRARGFKKDKWIYEIAKSIIKPDLAFFFDVPVEIAVSRVRERPNEKDRFIDMDLQHQLRKNYIDICRANNGILINTEMSKEDCYNKIKYEVERVLKHERIR
jgi:dTMP kinase